MEISDWRSGYFLACGGRWHPYIASTDRQSLRRRSQNLAPRNGKLALGGAGDELGAVDHGIVYLGTTVAASTRWTRKREN